MTPLDRLRIEKAAADCGFEMTPIERDGGLELRSARFPETVLVRPTNDAAHAVTASDAGLFESADAAGVVTVEGFGALYDVLRTAAAHARTMPNRVADAFRRETAGMPRSTEAERVVVQRVGQNLFRAALLDYWQGRCCVTGLDIPELLRASHIKPWSDCESDNERLDVFNGLLLAPHVDALFDGGWISFSDEGKVLTSEALPPDAAGRLGLRSDWLIRNLRAEHLRYLAFHRQHELRGKEDQR
ncbi:HNH endonuclease [Kinneretia aquatilis]|uniref:HNH endonuclease n=1 Tax=Kinneretia aquatilis TaxID=2070761 RepID=UPI0014952797|nr:HNH endonuclease [Paucibacter aquatile]WIV99686.1 HNH endonuclease [Paucibacter aquatile]